MTIEKFRSAFALIGAVAFTGGCTAHARGTAYTEADAPVVNVDNPTLVEIDAGVWVIRDHNEPVYFVNDEYWVYRSGAWYRSHGYEGGWVVVEASAVPPVIVHRDHRAYVHFHGGPAAQTRAAPRRAREGEHAGRPEHAGAPRAGEQHHDEGRGPVNERKTEERQEGHGEHDGHADQHQEGHDHDEGRANDAQHRGEEGRGKKNEKDKGRKK